MANSSHPSLILSDRKARNKTRGTRYSYVGNLRVITGNNKPKNLQTWPLPENNSEQCEIPNTMFPQSQFLQYPQQIPPTMYPQQMPQPNMYLQIPHPEYLQSQPPPGYLFNQVSPVNIDSYNCPQMELSPTFGESMSNLLSDNKIENLPKRKRMRNRTNRSASYWQRQNPVENSAQLYWQKRNRKKKDQKYEPKSEQKYEPKSQEKYEPKSQQKNEPKSQKRNKFGQNKYKYNWYNKKYKSAYEKLSSNLIDNLDEVSDGPLEDEAFEEVEVASGSDDNKNNEISVGFRKSKPVYLKGKGFGFFKPKVVKLSQTKTFVKCTNEESHKDIEEVDLVSDVEDDHPEIENVNPDVESVQPDLEEVQPDHDDVHPDLEDVQPVLDDGHLDLEDVNLDLEDVSEAEYEEVADCDEFLNENMLIIDDDEEDSEENISPIIEKELLEVPQINDKQHSELKEPEIIKTPADLYQGNAIYQDSLDKWNSHLIGLEYILEIWDKPGGGVKCYHCTLCNEDISVPKSFVSNKFIAVHISNNKHMSSYIISEHFKFVS